jgi:hypothetical protein
MLEVNYPPRKDHLVTAKMLDLYEASAETQLEMIKNYAESKPNLDAETTYELKLRINLQKAWLSQIKKIRRDYFKKLYTLATMYIDLELEVFCYAIIKKESIEKISEKVDLTPEEIKLMVDKFAEDMGSISLLE